jgi:hypothetical protein
MPARERGDRLAPTRERRRQGPVEELGQIAEGASLTQARVADSSTRHRVGPSTRLSRHGDRDRGPAAIGRPGLRSVPIGLARTESPEIRCRLCHMDRLLTFGTLIPMYIGSVRNSFA